MRLVCCVWLVTIPGCSGVTGVLCVTGSGNQSPRPQPHNNNLWSWWPQNITTFLCPPHCNSTTAAPQHRAEDQLQQFRKETDFRETDTGDGHVIGNGDKLGTGFIFRVGSTVPRRWGDLHCSVDARHVTGTLSEIEKIIEWWNNGTTLDK